MNLKISTIFLALIIFGTNILQAQAFEVSGWIPYWRSEEGVESALENLNAFTEVDPFVYTVKQDGNLYRASSLKDKEWVKLRKEAEANGVRFTPTVMWANADAMEEILSDETKRQNHIRSITSEVFNNRLDGIDIDYEAKYARTRPFFSLFLKELNEAIGYDKWIMCTIEARTPLDSRYSSPDKIPADIEYANDFKEINKYCDRVRIMAYDQGRIDLKLNKSNEHPYIPVADPAWVEKAVRLAMEDIDPQKILIGVPTYGYEYDMFEKDGYTQYSRLWSFNPNYALDQADEINEDPERSENGELMLVFPAKKSIDKEAIPLPDATRVMVWNDAESIRKKAELARELGVAGISIFKIDGGEDPKLADVLRDFKTVSNDKLKTPTLAISSNLSLPKIPSMDLEKGDVSDDVKNLQKILNSLGFTIASSGPGSPGLETNIFGSLTEAALIRFQSSKSISPAIGYFGPKTHAEIQLSF